METNFLAEITNRCSFQKALTFNKPYQYKSVDFYPVPIEFLIEFNMCVNILMIRQEWIKEKKLAKLPYLWFLAYAFENNEKYNNAEYALYIPMLYALLELSTHSKDIRIDVERKENGDYQKCHLFINNIPFGYKNFNEIRKIILEQSAVEYDPDEFINEDTFKAMNEGKGFENKQKNYIPPTLENLIDILSMYLHKSVDEIVASFTIRKFNNIIRYMSSFEEWKLLRGAALSGFVTFKEEIPHWISGFDRSDSFKNENQDYMSKIKN